MSIKKPDPIDQHVGSRVKMRRLVLGISQEKLADAVGVTFQQVQKYEKGANRMGSSRLMQVANALKVTPAFFFEDAVGKAVSKSAHASPNYVTGFLASPDGLALARAFTSISNKKLRRSIVSLVEDVTDKG